MSSQEETTPPSAEERARLRKQMGEHAVRLAIASRWEEAAKLNREYVRQFDDDPEGFNRLGKALSELGKIEDAFKAYRKSAELDPTNVIAKRNLDRLSTMKKAGPQGPVSPSEVDTRLFVEETGKASVANLQAVDTTVASLLHPGDRVDLQLKGNAVNVHTRAGEYLGMLEPRLGLRLARLMGGGNEYAAALVTAIGDPRVIVRETFQHPSQIDRVSFPQSLAGDVRPYTRRTVLRHQLGDDADYSEDDEVVEPEEEERGWSETSEDGDTTVQAASDTDDDAEGFN